MRPVVLLAIALALLSLPATSSGQSNVTSGNLTLLSGVPDTRQSHEYSCAAAAMQAVLSYWGRDIGETDLMELLNTDPEVGTYPDEMVRAARQLGFKAYYKENVTLEEVESSIEQGMPVIVDGQAWRWAPRVNESWADDYGDGHYMVVIGMDDKNVYLEDPYILGSTGFMSRGEFEERWHNLRGLDPSDEVKQKHLAIFIKGGKPPVRDAFRHID